MKEHRVDVDRLPKHIRSQRVELGVPPTPISRAPGDDGSLDEHIADTLRDEGPMGQEWLVTLVADRNGNLTAGVDTVWSRDDVSRMIDELALAGRLVRDGDVIDLRSKKPEPG